jgi:hypothetical protein
MPPPPTNTLATAVELVRRTWAQLDAATFYELLGRTTEQQILQLSRDPAAAIWCRWPEYRSAESEDDRLDVFIDAMREVLTDHCDPYTDTSLRMRLRQAKGEGLGSCNFKWSAAATEPDDVDQGAYFGRSTPALRIETVEDLLSQRFEIMLGAADRQQNRMASNYQTLFEMFRDLTSDLMRGLERRSARVEAHNLDLYTKRIEEKKAAFSALEDDRREDAQVKIQSKAIDTAGSVVGRVAEGVLTALGFEGGGAMSEILGVLKSDPELIAELSSPGAIEAMKNPEVRGLFKSMFKQFSTGTLPAEPANPPSQAPQE